MDTRDPLRFLQNEVARLKQENIELRDELTHPFVTPVEYLGIVVVTHILVLHHVLEIAYDLGALQIDRRFDFV